MEFEAWPKTGRLFRDIVVTEKIDGTNAAINIQSVTEGSEVLDPLRFEMVRVGDDYYYIGAQSRNRLIHPGKNTDNHGFAGWVRDNAVDLVEILGEGRHYGEWWGQGVARKYGLDHKRFSLFNTDKWRRLEAGDYANIGDAVLTCVPVLYHGPFSERAIQECLYDLQTLGSVAAPGFPNAEGVCVYHTQTRRVYKVTLDNEDKGKWEVA